MPREIQLRHFTGPRQRHYHQSSTPVKGYSAGLCLQVKHANNGSRGTVGGCKILLQDKVLTLQVGDPCLPPLGVGVGPDGGTGEAGQTQHLNSALCSTCGCFM